MAHFIIARDMVLPQFLTRGQIAGYDPFHQGAKYLVDCGFTHVRSIGCDDQCRKTFRPLGEGDIKLCGGIA